MNSGASEARQRCQPELDQFFDSKFDLLLVGPLEADPSFVQGGLPDLLLVGPSVADPSFELGCLPDVLLAGSSEADPSFVQGGSHSFLTKSERLFAAFVFLTNSDSLFASSIFLTKSDRHSASLLIKSDRMFASFACSPPLDATGQHKM